ncbi:unnamed protein product [Orchesella dallaii]|uniref:Uncharacterized protein n=1 Tax=Orchesella dallaii TaxID=48710 RepID=A0ABP1QMB3_9HEXA
MGSGEVARSHRFNNMRTLINNIPFCVIACFILVCLLNTVQVDCAELVAESETKTIEPTNNPTKVFIRRRIFRKLVKDSNSTEDVGSSTTSEQPPTTTRARTLYSLVKRVDKDKSGTVTGKAIKSGMNSQSLLPKHKFNFAQLKDRLGITADASTTTPSPRNSSLVMIPLPPNQRKPYTPVIMQVSKSTTASPETKVQTFKLNKMFVPIGIYGKVIENGTESSETVNIPSNASTPAPQIKHRGTAEPSSNRKVKGIADSVDLTYSYRPKADKVSLTTVRPDIGAISITTEMNELFSSLSNNNVRRGDSSLHSSEYNHSPWNKVSNNDGMTLMTPPSLGTPGPGQYPTRKNSGLSFVDSITDSMSRIPSLVPSLFHKGLTSLASMTSSLKENPFVDENFSESQIPQQKQKPLISAPSSYKQKIPASVPGGYISSGGEYGRDRERDREVEYNSRGKDQYGSGSEMQASSGVKSSDTAADIEYETLEYFRKRPHLLKQAQQAAWRRSQGVRMSKGFKPVSAPEHLAREYYASTTTTGMPARRNAKRGSWLLRNSDEYVANSNDKLVRSWRSLFDTFSKNNAEAETKLSNRRSILNAQWTDITKKYSRDQIDEAKERILTLLDSGYGDELDHELLSDDELQHSHMPPPPPHAHKGASVTKGLSAAAAGAFKDLLKFFKLGVNVGTGHSNNPVNYEEIVDDQEEKHSDWKPVRRPLISFSAGISLKNPLARDREREHPHHHSHGHSHFHGHGPSEPSHYSSSSKPYIPNQFSGLKTYIDEFATAHIPSKPQEIHTHEQAYVDEPPAQQLDYDQVDEVLDDSPGYDSEQSLKYATSAPVRHATHPHVTEEYEPAVAPDYDSTSEYSNIRYSTKRPSKPTTPVPEHDMEESDSNWKPVGSEYELVPSDVYLNTPHGGEIAAVVKPEGISDDVVKSALPARLRDLPTLNYPNEFAYASNLNSISQYLGNNKAPKDSKFKHAMKKLRDNYVVKESSYLPPKHASPTSYPTRHSSLNDYSGYSTFGNGYASQLGSLNSQLGSLTSSQLNSLSASQLASLSSLSGNGGGYSSAGLSSLAESYSPQLPSLGDYSSALRASALSSASQLSGLSGLSGFSSPSQLSSLYQLQSSNSPYLRSPLASALAGNLGQNVLVTANQINNHASQRPAQQNQAYPQKDSLGFTNNYDLPTNLDPDIAAILKSELDKDDIPEDVRQEFLEAKREEEAKAQKQQQQQQQQQAQQSQNRRVDIAQQTLLSNILSSTQPTASSRQQHHIQQLQQVQQQQHHIQQQQQQRAQQQQHQSQQQQHQSQQQVHYHVQQAPRSQLAQSRVFNPPHQNRFHAVPQSAPPVITTRFFAPIPITPTLMTTALRNPRYQSPVPRYVIELAKKLQQDKTVQGIVRVSAKRGRGLPPIEYLYPVKG